MPTEFKLPAVSEGVDSADVGDVHVSEGDTIEAGQVVLEVETEKAVADIPCPHAGTVEKVHVSTGDTVSVGEVLLTIEESETADGGAKGSDSASDSQQEAGSADSEDRDASDDEPADASPQQSQSTGGETQSEPQPKPRKRSPEDVGKLVVLGGGPGGYPAAFQAADMGIDVVLVNDEEIPGGVCLHRGCIPSKALLHTAKLIQEAREAHEWGITFGEPEIDLDKLRGFKSDVVGRLTGGVAELCKTRGVKLIHGRGRFLDSQTLEITGKDGDMQELKFDHCIIATGSSPAMPGVFDVGDDRVMDSTAALELPDVPNRLLVVGGGYIGLEMGSVYAAIGSEVTVVEMLPGILAGADRDLVRPLKKRLESLFKAIHLETKVESLTASDDGIVAKLAGDGVEPEQTFDRVLISVGRVPNSRDLGLENTGVELDDRGFIKVDSFLRTADDRLLAVGDVAGEPMLAHKATREGKVAVEALAGEPAEFDSIAIPAVVFTDPEVAWCGLTETEAKEQGRDVKVAKFPWAASGRAQTLDRTEGLTKLIYDPETERVLGVGIVGVNAGDLIAEGVLAVETAAVARDVAESIHAHPTLSETVMESAETIYGQATHFYRGKRK